MISKIDNLVDEYDRAEITSLFLHDKKKNVYFNLYTLIELVPCEQESSSLILDESPYMDRLNKGLRNHTIFLTRTIDLPVREAINVFQKAESGIDVVYQDKIKGIINIFDNVRLQLEPAEYNPILLNGSDDNKIGYILPTRHTCQRVWIKLDMYKTWETNFTEKELDQIIENAGHLTVKHLAFDISTRPEHLGNIYMTGCNPIIRGYSSTLINEENDLLLKFKERKGKHIKGHTLLLEEKRGENYGFSIKTKINAPLTRIQLPYFPNNLVTKIYSPYGQLLEVNTGTWVNFHVNMNILSSEVNITIKGKKGDKKLKVPKHGKSQPVNIGKYDHAPAQYFESKSRPRLFEQLEKTKEFIFFQGGIRDKDKASSIVHELLNKASDRCMILDPYFGSIDIEYAIGVQNTSIPVQIISSARFLNEKIDKNKKGPSQAEQLQNVINQYKNIYPNQIIECRVLRGKDKSPLHDRYIIIDDSVFLLGSSFNEFGSRATTLIKIPAPEPMIQQALKWWESKTEIIALSDFVSQSV